jgi:hypothetical protein
MWLLPPQAPCRSFLRGSSLLQPRAGTTLDTGSSFPRHAADHRHQPHMTTPPALHPAAPILPVPVLPHSVPRRSCAQSRQLSPTSCDHSSSPTFHGARRGHQHHGFTPPCVGPPSSRPAPVPVACSMWAAHSCPALPLLPPAGPRQRQRLSKLLDLICLGD